MPAQVRALPAPAIPRASLRLEVARLRHEERSRWFTAAVHAGTPGGVEARFTLEPDQPLDHALRAEVAGALVSRTLTDRPAPLFWLTRAGELGAEDLDLEWYAAARTAYGEAGLPLVMVVITKRGWRDVAGSDGREWKRLRLRSRAQSQA